MDGLIGISEVDRFDLEADVVVVGLGCAGASAVIEACDAGAEVLCLERAGGGGGTSANSGGLIYLGGGTPVQQACGFDDPPEELQRFLLAASGPGADAEKIALFCEHSVEHFHWLEAQKVPFKRGFHPEPSLECPTDDGLVYSGGEDCHPWNAIAKPAPRGHKPQVEGKAGPFFMRCLLATTLAKPARFEWNARVDALLVEGDGRVGGVRFRQLGETRCVRARGGVVLAAGGFSSDRAMMERHVPRLLRCTALNCTEGDDGAAIRMAQAAGADVVRMDQAEVALPATIPVRLARGVMVNGRAQRFVNEDTYYGHVGIEALQHQDGRVFFVHDETTFERGLVGMAPQAVAESFEELAVEVGLPADAFGATLEFYNRHAARGEDPLFHKRPEFLTPLATPPFAIVDCSPEHFVYAGMTLGGLRTSPQARVQSPEGAEIDGLWAAGRTAALFTGRGYAGSGISLSDGTFFGRRAGRDAAARARR